MHVEIKIVNKEAASKQSTLLLGAIRRLQKPKKFKAQKSPGKITATIFWDVQEVILVHFLPKEKTINSQAYMETLQKLRERIRQVRPIRR